MLLRLLLRLRVMQKQWRSRDGQKRGILLLILVQLLLPLLLLLLLLRLKG